MSGIFTSSGRGGSIFGGSGAARPLSGLGSLFDFLDDTEDEAGNTTDGGGPTTTDGTLITGTANPNTPKQSPGAIPKVDSCVKPHIDDPLNPTKFCILDPKGNYTCPPKQIYDPYAKKCVPYAPDLIAGAVPQTGVICPYGTKAVGSACVSLVSPIAQGTPAKGPVVITDPGANVDVKTGLAGGTVKPWMIALAAAGLLAMGGVAIAAKKKNDRSQRRNGRARR